MVDEVEFDIMDTDDQSRFEDGFSDNFDYDPRASARKKAGRKLSEIERENAINDTFTDSSGCY